jgi:hypothetical protein
LPYHRSTSVKRLSDSNNSGESKSEDEIFKKFEDFEEEGDDAVVRQKSNVKSSVTINNARKSLNLFSKSIISKQSMT